MREALRLNLITTGGFKVRPVSGLKQALHLEQPDTRLLINKSLLQEKGLLPAKKPLVYQFHVAAEPQITQQSQPYPHIALAIPETHLLGFSQCIIDALSLIAANAE
ncbi:MAG: hypothetical protein ACFHVJ_02965 [Aestuariibacter sp.]